MRYWEDRVESQKKILLGKSIQELENELATIYKSSMREVEKDMRSLYLEILNQSKDGEVKINDLYRYNRYWEVKNDINRRLQAMGQKEIKIMDKNLVGMYMSVQDYFNKNPKFLARTKRGIVKELSAIPVDLHNPIVSEKAREVVNSVWCADGKYWSERVWGNKEKLGQTLEKGLSDVITRGSNPEELTQLIKKDFNTSYSRADSLVRTELSHIYNTAAIQRYSDAGCSAFEIITAGDERTCEDCEALNGKVVEITEMVDGDNCPPFH